MQPGLEAQCGGDRLHGSAAEHTKLSAGARPVTFDLETDAASPASTAYFQRRLRPPAATGGGASTPRAPQKRAQTLPSHEQPLADSVGTAMANERGACAFKLQLAADIRQVERCDV